MLFIIEILEYDDQYSDEKSDSYWNKEIYGRYKEICYVKIQHVFNMNRQAEPEDYVMTTANESFLFRD